MSRTSHRGSAARLAALATMAAGASARAQCDWYVQHVPDFDQRRQNTPTVTGLPGDGSMYCVPTSTLNWCAYIANHGYPGVMNGPRKWSNQANYDFVTARDAFMGSLMGTDPVGGTGGSGWLNGAMGYLGLFAAGQFDVTVSGGSGAWGPSTGDLYLSHLLGGLVMLGYGRYTESPAGFFTRNGGHVMTLAGMKDLCSSSPTLLQFRDPASDADNTTQSPFATTDPLPVQRVTAFFRGGTSDIYRARTMYRFTTFGTPSFYDGIGVIWPKCGLTTGSNLDLPETIQVLHPVQLTGKPFPLVQDFSTPTGGTVRDLAMNSRLSQYYYITGPVGTTPTEFFRFDPGTGQSTQIMGFSNPTRIASGRQGQFYILDSGAIIRYDPDLPPTSSGPPSTASQGVDTLVFDDFTDQLVGYDGATHTVFLWNAGLAGNPVSMLLAPPCLGGRVSLAISPVDASLWLCSRNCDAIYKITGNLQTGLRIVDTINLPAGSGPAGLNVGGDGHVFFSSNGLLHEMERNSDGVWIDSPSPVFGGMAAGTTFFLSRSRTNFDTSMTGPGYVNLPDPEVIQGTPDCYANCDGSTIAPVLNVNDFACFLNEFASGDPEANCDDSTSQPVLNVNDFACFLNKFAAGCP